MTNEEWIELQIQVLKEIARVTVNYKTQVLLIAGDVFDSSKAPVWFVTKMAQVYKKLFRHLITGFCYGQHDLPYHSYQDKKNSPTYNWSIITGAVEYGNSWEQEIVWSPVTMIHRYAYKGVSEIPNMDPTCETSWYLQQAKRIVITGDNHVPFIARLGNKTHINCGGILGRTVREKNKNKYCYIVDNWECLKVPLQVGYSEWDETYVAPKVKHVGIEIDKTEIQSFTADHIDQLILSQLKTKQQKQYRLITQHVREKRDSV